MPRRLDPRIAVGEREEGAALGAEVERVRVGGRRLAEHRRPGRPGRPSDIASHVCPPSRVR